MMKKQSVAIPPVIGISMGRIAPTEHTSTGGALATIPLSFLDILARAGAVPIAIPNNPVGADRLAPMISGLLLIGGDDITTQTDRDKTELELVRRAIERKIPVLGVCRGAQLLNTYYGGTLYRHLLDDLPGAEQHCETGPHGSGTQIWHDIAIEPGSMVALIAEATSLKVNSDHHQGIDKVGAGLKVTATSPDGVVEAIEIPGKFIVGLQWHPERIVAENPVQEKFFQAFVDATRVKKGRSRARAAIFKRLLKRRI